jgi:hypothetical protein
MNYETVFQNSYHELVNDNHVLSGFGYGRRASVAADLGLATSADGQMGN